LCPARIDSSPLNRSVMQPERLLARRGRSWLSLLAVVRLRMSC